MLVNVVANSVVSQVSAVTETVGGARVPGGPMLVYTAGGREGELQADRTRHYSVAHQRNTRLLKTVLN